MLYPCGDQSSLRRFLRCLYPEVPSKLHLGGLEPESPKVDNRARNDWAAVRIVGTRDHQVALYAKPVVTTDPSFLQSSSHE